jgi:hypothetical protein
MGGIWFWYSPNWTHIIPYHNDKDIKIIFKNYLK